MPGLMSAGNLHGPASASTTLRFATGSQTVGVVAWPLQKLDIAYQFDELGVRRIEAGLLRVSPGMPKRSNSCKEPAFVAILASTDLSILISREQAPEHRLQQELFY